MIETFAVDPRLAVKEDRDDLFIIPPQVINVGWIDEDSYREFSASVSKATQSGQTILPIVINSTGGEVYSLLGMVDILASVKIPVATIVEGSAMSSAAVLFACGTLGCRYIGPNASLMIHDVTETSAKEKTEDIKSDANELDRLNKSLYKMLEDHRTPARGRRRSIWSMVQDQGRSDLYLTAKEAIRLGLADHIGIPTFRTSIVVDTILEL